jgi:hypothetical protein
MSKWRLIIALLAVLLIGLVAYLLQSAPEQQPADQVPAAVTEPQVDIADRPLDVTGDESVEAQADALIDEMLLEPAEEERSVGEGMSEVRAETAGEEDKEILDVEYYEE